VADNPYRNLRELALSTRAADIGITDTDPSALFGAVMDLRIDEAYATVVSFLTGDASIYLSSGGGFIGGRDHENVRKAAKAFVAVASQFRGRMTMVTDHPLPGTGMTTFFALTPGGLWHVKEREDDLMKQTSPFTPLYAAGQDVITAFSQIPNGQR
jgi:hypothetical protein